MVKLLSSIQRWSASSRSRGVELKVLREKARHIARAYKGAATSSEQDRWLIGQRKTQRLAVAPRFRAISILKRDTYDLACMIRTRLDLDTICRAVVLRDERWKHYSRPRNPTSIDWALRLVRGALLGKPAAIGAAVPVFLFSDKLLSELSVELNFAYRHEIDAAYLTMFVDELGGSEIIAARVAAGEYDFRFEEWIRALRNSRHPLQDWQPKERLQLWAKYSSRIDPDDLDDEPQPASELLNDDQEEDLDWA